MRPHFLQLALLAGIAGCGQSFKDENQELRYLESLSNPSPTQFKRREELQLRLGKEAIAEKAKQLESQAAEAKARDSLDKSVADQALINRSEEVLKAAIAKAEGIGQTVPEIVVKQLREVCEKYPNTPAAEKALQLLPEWEARVNGTNP